MSAILIEYEYGGSLREAMSACSTYAISTGV
jgi:hypothetical protein